MRIQRIMLGGAEPPILGQGARPDGPKRNGPRAGVGFLWRRQPASPSAMGSGGALEAPLSGYTAAKRLSCIQEAPNGFS